MFKSARIKLTAYYLLIIMIVTLSFSAVVYSRVTTQIEGALRIRERRFDSKIPNLTNPPAPISRPFLDEEIIKEVRKNTFVTLTTINVFVLIAAGIPGYWLAGKTLKPIEEMVEKQKKFVTDAAHELKTPLTAMKTNLEVNLRNKKLSIKDAKGAMESTVQDVDSLTILINSLLKQSRYQSYSDGNKETIDLRELMEKILGKMDGRLENKKIRSKISGENIKIKFNKNSISELFTILIDNAIKFNKNDGFIDIKLEKKDNLASVEIKDTGIGIEEKDIPYVFDRFYKAETSRSKVENDGFGLGLSIAKEIVDSCNGSILVNSEKDKGTTFTVKLPTDKG